MSEICVAFAEQIIRHLSKKQATNEACAGKTIGEIADIPFRSTTRNSAMTAVSMMRL